VVKGDIYLPSFSHDATTHKTNSDTHFLIILPSDLKMDAVYSFKALVYSQKTTWCNNA
jgi:hypothetical protein